MSAAALVGLLTGFTKGETEKLKREREEEETLLFNRLKIAASNKKELEEETLKLKQAAKDRLLFVDTNFPTATEQQKIAIASNPFLANSLKAKLESGQTIDLNNDLVLNKDKIKWDSAKTYVNSIGQGYVPAIDMGAIESKENVFGMKISPKRSKIEAAASALGGGTSPEELLAYERATKRPDDLEGIGSLREGFFKKPRSFDQQIDDQLNKVFELSQTSPGSQEFSMQKNKLAAMVTWKETLNPTQATIASKINDLGLKANEYAKAGDTENEAKLLTEIRRLQSYTSTKDPNAKGSFDSMTVSQISSSLNKGIVARLTEYFGPDVSKDLIIETSGDGTSNFRYVGTEESLRKAIYEKRNEIVRNIASPWIIKNKPTTAAARQAIASTGIKINSDGTLSDEIVFFKRDNQATPEANQTLIDKATGKPTAAPAPAAPTKAPQAAIDLLMKNPTEEVKRQFKAKYGYLPEGV